MTLDDIRRAYPQLGLALYAYDPAGVVTLELHAPDGNVLTYHASSSEEVFARVFPELLSAPETIGAETENDADEEPDIFS